MNIKEREQYLQTKIDVMRLGGGKEEKAELDTSLMTPKFDWNQLVKPSMLFYIPQRGIDEIYNITTEPRLMNNGKKKFELMNQALQQYGFFPLASGTNRRTFYCEYDPTIILKIGSDKIGRSDNISEYWMQQLLKPYCYKMYEVHPSGVIALGERVETMNEKDFKSKWAGEIFDLIMNLMYSGYMLEDVGGNYFKNWGVRVGFGPVLVDFPYVYKIDWSKLRCIAKDTNGIQCGGGLDYDYQKGMSEIVCTKCGKRYAANYLAKLGNDSVLKIYGKGKVFNMTNNNGLQFTIKRGSKVIHSSYNEVTSRKEINDNAPIITIRKQTFDNNGNSEVEEIRPVFRASTSKPDYGVKDGILTNEEIGMILDLVLENYGKKMAIGLARKLNVYYKDPSERGSAPAIQPRRDAQRSTTSMPISVTATKTTEATLKKSDGLFPVVPKTAEELQREDTLKREEKNSVLGIPGEPVAQTMKIKNAVPMLKKMITDKYDHKVELTADTILSVTRLEEGIKQLIGNTVASVTNTSVDGLDVMVNTSFDTQNRTCFSIEVEHYKSPILQMAVYPKENDKEGKSVDVGTRNIEPGINPLDSTKTESIEDYLIKKSQSYAVKYKHLNDKDFTTTMNSLLVIDLQTEKNMKFDEACKIVEDFIESKSNNIDPNIVSNY